MGLWDDAESGRCGRQPGRKGRGESSRRRWNGSQGTARVAAAIADRTVDAAKATGSDGRSREGCGKPRDGCHPRHR
jgi:hypothetical protein